jgi:hypothetical protein
MALPPRMMVTLHDCDRLKAVVEMSAEAVWVELLGADGRELVTMFFDSYTRAKAVADAINGAQAPAQAEAA